MTIGLAMALPLTGAIVVARFQPERRGRALGVVATAMALGRISGPVLGGLILSLWSWQGIFLAGALIGICASVVVFIVLKGSDQRLDEPFDLWGGLALFVGYPALLIALSLGPSWGWWTSPVLFCFLLSIIAWVGFFLIELRTEKPLIRLALFSDSIHDDSPAVYDYLLGSVFTHSHLCSYLFAQRVGAVARDYRSNLDPATIIYSAAVAHKRLVCRQI